MNASALQPLTKWRCDVCGELIEDIDKGYVTWHGVSESGAPYGFKIIHQKVCDDNKANLSAALRDFLGTDGLAKLLAFLSVGSLKAAQGQSPRVVGDLDELVDFMRRVQTPYYEEARQRFSEEEVTHDFYDSNEVAPYLQSRLKRIAAGG